MGLAQIVEHFLLGKKGTRSARHLRSIFSTWGELKDSAPKSKKNKDWIEELFVKEFILNTNKKISNKEKTKQTNLRSIYYKKACPIKDTV